jgi:hypothetical protein
LGEICYIKKVQVLSLYKKSPRRTKPGLRFKPLRPPNNAYELATLINKKYFYKYMITKKSIFINVAEPILANKGVR